MGLPTKQCLSLVLQGQLLSWPQLQGPAAENGKHQQASSLTYSRGGLNPELQGRQAGSTSE